jgi:hypothetical protein
MAVRQSASSGCCEIYFLQQWFNLSDPAVEEALYDSLAMRSFVGIDLGREPVPDETTVCRFRGTFDGCGSVRSTASASRKPKLTFRAVAREPQAKPQLRGLISEYLGQVFEYRAR